MGASRRPLGGLWARSCALSRHLGSFIEGHIAPSGTKANELVGGFWWLLWGRDNRYVTCSIRLLEVILAYLVAIEIYVCLSVFSHSIWHQIQICLLAAMVVVVKQGLTFIVMSSEPRALSCYDK